MEKRVYDKCLKLLNKELVLALGCTEPIAVAYASAYAKKTLGTLPEKIEISASGNIIKNVKSVIVPNTDGMKGIEVACLAGIFGGDADKKLEVLQSLKKEDIENIKSHLNSGYVSVVRLGGASNLHIIVKAFKGEESALVEIIDEHINIVRIEKNGKTVYEKPKKTREEEKKENDLTISEIYEFANEVKIEDVKPLLDKQIEYNTKISDEGLAHNYGVNVGRTLMNLYGNDVKIRARAKAAAGSDARMSGCDMPVVISSGSGNQGITVSLPVIEYARELKVEDETLYRALSLSNLAALHLKKGIGALSAYCGVVSAACGSGAGITYLCKGTLSQIENTITNTLANISGMVCDGAKPSCAAKIASAVDAAIMGHLLAMQNTQFEGGDGIIKENIEATIDSVNRLATVGMRETDNEILKIMTEDIGKKK